MSYQIKIVSFLLLMGLSNFSFGNNVTYVYFFSGQGSDERIFEKIYLNTNFQIVHINYPIPKKGATMAEYAREISLQIDTTQKYIFIGVSLGGMICSELVDFLTPEKIIVISSAKCREELPFRYRFQKSVPLNKIIPGKLIKIGAQVLQPFVEPDRSKNKDVFKSMLKNKHAIYYKRTVNMIINWNRERANSKIIHIHGTNDHTIPIRNVQVNFIIDKGSHMMTLTRGEEINNLIQSILTQEIQN